MVTSPTPILAQEDHVSEAEGLNQGQRVGEAERQIPHLPIVTVTPSIGDRSLHELGDGGTPLVHQGHDQDVIVATPQDAGNCALSPATPWDPPIPSHLLSHTATEEVRFLTCRIFSTPLPFVSF